jgi:tripartite-type tricarboxylate transporter receptor subunit TctC
MRRVWGILGAVPVLLAADLSFGQTNYPERAIRLVVGFPAGSGIDIIGRVLGQGLTEALGKPVVVENVPGAAGSIATERAARAAPDGYTLAVASQGQIVINPILSRMPFDPMKDLTPISQVYLSSNLLVVNNAAPPKTVLELVALARTRPGEFTFATGGSGSSPHLAGALFRSMAGIDIREVPYKGVNAALPDLLGGRVTMMFSPIAEVSPAVREGKLRALAVTSSKRSPAFPDLPTIDEAGIRGFDVTFWGGLFAPTGVPETILRRLHAETTNLLGRPEVRVKLADLGVGAMASSPPEFSALIESEIPRWAKVIKEAGIRADQ